MEEKDFEVAQALRDLCHKHNLAEFFCSFRRGIGDHSVTHDREFVYKSKHRNLATQTEICELTCIEKKSL